MMHKKFPPKRLLSFLVHCGVKFTWDLISWFGSQPSISIPKQILI